MLDAAHEARAPVLVACTPPFAAEPPNKRILVFAVENGPPRKCSQFSGADRFSRCRLHADIYANGDLFGDSGRNCQARDHHRPGDAARIMRAAAAPVGTPWLNCRVEKRVVGFLFLISKFCVQTPGEEIPALRDFDPGFDRCGSIATLLAEATRPFMSAMPPEATKTGRHSETTRCANTGSHPGRPDVRSTGHRFLVAPRATGHSVYSGFARMRRAATM
jgi:hypothetical protein